MEGLELELGLGRRLEMGRGKDNPTQPHHPGLLAKQHHLPIVQLVFFPIVRFSWSVLPIHCQKMVQRPHFPTPGASIDLFASSSQPFWFFLPPPTSTTTTNFPSSSNFLLTLAAALPPCSHFCSFYCF